MLRGLLVLAGVVLVCVGVFVTYATLTVNGWLVLAVVGIFLIFGAQRCPHSLLERHKCFYCHREVGS